MNNNICINTGLRRFCCLEKHWQQYYHKLELLYLFMDKCCPHMAKSNTQSKTKCRI